jgi:hypothetical protein
MIGNGGHAAQIKAEFSSNLNVVAIGDNVTRRRVVLATEAGARMRHPEHLKWWARGLQATLLPPYRAIPMDRIGAGTVVFAGACIGAESKIGKHCIINHNAVVEHHAIIEDFAHIAPGACVLGGARVSEGALIGANAVILPGCHVPPWAIVRACTVYPHDYLLSTGFHRLGQGRQLALRFQDPNRKDPPHTKQEDADATPRL